MVLSFLYILKLRVYVLGWNHLIITKKPPSVSLIVSSLEGSGFVIHNIEHKSETIISSQ